VMHKFSSPPSSLSSPPSALSEPVSPTRFLNAGRANIEMDEIIVDPGSVTRFGVMQQQAQALNPPPPNVPLTAAGLPRKKPGRKPGSTVKPKVAADGTVEPLSNVAHESQGTLMRLPFSGRERRHQLRAAMDLRPWISIPDHSQDPLEVANPRSRSLHRCE